ncbi:MAG: hypothetical protein QOH31_2533, partial [Verrucomicrobiota bacterium]
SIGREIGFGSGDGVRQGRVGFGSGDGVRAGRSATAESLIIHCPARPGQVATQNFGNGFRPNWVGSRRSFDGRGATRPTFLSTATKTTSSQKKKNLNYSITKTSKRSAGSLPGPRVLHGPRSYSWKTYSLLSEISATSCSKSFFATFCGACPLGWPF